MSAPLSPSFEPAEAALQAAQAAALLTPAEVQELLATRGSSASGGGQHNSCLQSVRHGKVNVTVKGTWFAQTLFLLSTASSEPIGSYAQMVPCA